MQRREFLMGAAGAAVICGTSGCGTLLHSERCGQPHSRDLDWKIVALDALGLVLFFVPGVVAFVVDFYTGAIYLPAECCSPQPTPAMPGPGYPIELAPPPTEGAFPALTAPQAMNLQRVPVPRGELSPQRIEQVVSRHTGRPLSLASSETRVSGLTKLDRYEDQCRRHHGDRKFGLGIQALLARWRSA